MDLKRADIAKVPDKKYFRIGEVSRIVGVNAHVLRYWESEFKIIKPFRGKSKQRLYRQQDVQNLLIIRQLLHDERYTIAGAKKYLSGRNSAAMAVGKVGTKQKGAINAHEFIPGIKSELVEILEQLKNAGNTN